MDLQKSISQSCEEVQIFSPTTPSNPKSARKTSSTASGSDKQDIKVLKRRERNRIAAKECRERKKKYVQKLEDDSLHLKRIKVMQSNPVIYGREFVVQREEDIVPVNHVQARHSPLIGLWLTPGERSELWIAGYKPSSHITLVSKYLVDEGINEEQASAIDSLKKWSMDIEDALSQDLEKLKNTITKNVMGDSLLNEMWGTISVSSQNSAIPTELNNARHALLHQFEDFVVHVENLRKSVLVQLGSILTIHHMALYLLANEEYSNRLRALSLSSYKL